MRVLFMTAMLMIASGAAPAWAVDLDRETTFAIDSQPLSSALVDFSHQTQIQVMSSDSQLAERQTAGLKGRYTIRDALGRLLAGTDLDYSSVGPNTIKVTARSSEPAASGRRGDSAASGAMAPISLAQSAASHSDARTHTAPPAWAAALFGDDHVRLFARPSADLVEISNVLQHLPAIGLRRRARLARHLVAGQEHRGDGSGSGRAASSAGAQGLGRSHAARHRPRADAHRCGGPRREDARELGTRLRPGEAPPSPEFTVREGAMENMQIVPPACGELGLLPSNSPYAANDNTGA